MKGMGSSWVLGGLLAGTVLLAGFGAGHVAAAPAPASNQAAALAAFDTIQTVLQHPRCQSCHIPGDAPLQFDAGLVHNQNVQRGSNGLGAPGFPCATCHGTKNLPASYGAHMPPGAPGWRGTVSASPTPLFSGRSAYWAPRPAASPAFYPTRPARPPARSAAHQA